MSDAVQQFIFMIAQWTCT